MEINKYSINSKPIFVGFPDSTQPTIAQHFLWVERSPDNLSKISKPQRWR
ncbi:MAG: hypothetical protein WBA93_30595 [Microcoleaceae cyanobacterium]